MKNNIKAYTKQDIEHILELYIKNKLIDEDPMVQDGRIEHMPAENWGYYSEEAEREAKAFLKTIVF